MISGGYMADFGELCPLFNTGVFNELVFPNVRLTVCTACVNVLFSTADSAASSLGNWTFGRTVIVTDAWLRRLASADSAVVAELKHHTSNNAVGTTFASLTVSITLTGFGVYQGWVPMTLTDTTFTSTDVLGLCGASVVTSAGAYDLMIRYKEK
jgi:hypothetical protein